MSQLRLEFGASPSYAAADFLVSASNATAFGWIGGWPEWPAAALALCGSAGSGKTHLAHCWLARSHGRLINSTDLNRVEAIDLLGEAVACAVDPLEPGNLNALGERNLLHLCNMIAERRGHLLLCTSVPPARWTIVLPDLRSRLSAMPVALIEPPDDGLLESVVAKLFSDRQLAVDRGTVIYLVTRMERSFGAAQRLVAAIDEAALATGRRPNMSLARETLERLGDS